MKLSEPWKRALLAGACFAVAGMGCGAYFLQEAIGKGWHIMLVASGLSAFLCGAGLWRVFVAARESASTWLGAVIGGLTSIVALPPAWYGAILWNYFCGGPTITGSPRLDPYNGLEGRLADYPRRGRGGRVAYSAAPAEF
jgi:hypothetical protein